MALAAWRLMGNMLDWTALPTVIELLDPPDPELLIRQLASIRDNLRERSN